MGTTCTPAAQREPVLSSPWLQSVTASTATGKRRDTLNTRPTAAPAARPASWLVSARSMLLE